MTTDFCENGQHFSFDATNRNCGCSDAPDVFDGLNCATGTVLNDAQDQCVVDTTATDVNAARQEGIEVGKAGANEYISARIQPRCVMTPYFQPH